jgi:hypothetical protein
MKKVPGNLEMVQGSVIEKYIRCGKENCKCKKGRGHGPMYYLSFKEEGATKLIYIPKSKVKKVREQVKQFRQFKGTGSEISRLNREILKKELSRKG